MSHHTLIAPFVANIALAQASDRMKASAPDKMMPADKSQTMRACEKKALAQKIRMEDRARFVDACMAGGTK
jgi:hypothetical protein